MSDKDKKTRWDFIGEEPETGQEREVVARRRESGGASLPRRIEDQQDFGQRVSAEAETREPIAEGERSRSAIFRFFRSVAQWLQGSFVRTYLAFVFIWCFSLGLVMSAVTGSGSTVAEAVAAATGLGIGGFLYMFVLSTDFIIQLDDKWRRAIAEDRLPWWIGLIRLFVIVLPYYFYGWVPQKLCEWCFRRSSAGTQASPWAVGVVITFAVLVAGVLYTAFFGMLFGRSRQPAVRPVKRIVDSTQIPSRPSTPPIVADRQPSSQEASDSKLQLDKEISRLIQNLRGWESKTAFARLKQIGKPAVPFLLNALRSNDNQIRYSAAVLLYIIDNNAKDSIPVLVEALNDQDRNIVIWAVERLGSMGADAVDAVRPLLEAAAEAKSERYGDYRNIGYIKIRESFLDALTKIGPAALPILENSLNDNRRWVRYISAAAILRIGNSEKEKAALSVLSQASKEDSIDFRVWAVLQFARLGPVGVADLVKLLRYDKDGSVRRSAAWALGEIGSHAKDAVPHLARALSDSNWEVQLAALESLGKIGNEAKSAVPAIEAWKKKYGWSRQYLEVAEKTQDLIGEVPKSILLESLTNEEASIRAAGALLLGKKGVEASDSVTKLCELLRYDKDESVRRSAAWALGEIGSHAKDAVPHLARALSDSNWEVQLAALESLGKIGSEAKSAIPAIEEWQRRYRRRDEAEKALERIRGPAEL